MNQRIAMNDPGEPSALPSEVRKRYRVLGVTRGAEIHLEIWDELTKTGVVVPFPEALTVAANINLEIARIFDEMATHLDQDNGTVPEWERHISEWKKRNKGADGLN
jgi:hypothetical protein